MSNKRVTKIEKSNKKQRKTRTNFVAHFPFELAAKLLIYSLLILVPPRGIEPLSKV